MSVLKRAGKIRLYKNEYAFSYSNYGFAALGLVLEAVYDMMRVFGYDDTTCSRYILGAYRPVSHIGFAIGTLINTACCG